MLDAPEGERERRSCVREDGDGDVLLRAGRWRNKIWASQAGTLLLARTGQAKNVAADTQ